MTSKSSLKRNPIFFSPPWRAQKSPIPFQRYWFAPCSALVGLLDRYTPYIYKKGLLEIPRVHCLFVYTIGYLSAPLRYYATLWCKLCRKISFCGPFPPQHTKATEAPASPALHHRNSAPLLWLMTYIFIFKSTYNYILFFVEISNRILGTQYRDEM